MHVTLEKDRAGLGSGNALLDKTIAKNGDDENRVKEEDIGAKGADGGGTQGSQPTNDTFMSNGVKTLSPIPDDEARRLEEDIEVEVEEEEEEVEVEEEEEEHGGDVETGKSNDVKKDGWENNKSELGGFMSADSGTPVVVNGVKDKGLTNGDVGSDEDPEKDTETAKVSTDTRVESTEEASKDENGTSVDHTSIAPERKDTESEQDQPVPQSMEVDSSPPSNSEQPLPQQEVIQSDNLDKAETCVGKGKSDEVVENTDSVVLNKTKKQESNEHVTENGPCEELDKRRDISQPITAERDNQKTSKRRIEESKDGEQERSSSSGSSEVEVSSVESKRIRFDESIFEEDERERIIREFVEKTAESAQDISKNCEKLQQEINALMELARAKELEWNSIMRLLKLKEEMLQRIMFKKRQSEFITGKISNTSNIEFDSASQLLRAYNRGSQILAEIMSKSNRNDGPTQLINSGSISVTMLPSTSNASSSAPCVSNSITTSTSGATIQGHVNNYSDVCRSPSSPMLVNESSKLRTNRPILPKPPSSSILDPTNSIIGEGRQGNIIDVKSIIADFRSKNASDVHPRRGRRNIPVPRVDTGIAHPPRFLGNTSLLSMANMALGSGSHVRTANAASPHQEPTTNSFLLGQDSAVATTLKTDVQQRTGIDTSTMIMPTSGTIAGAASSHHNFQEALMKFAKINERRSADSVPSSTGCSPLQSNPTANSILQHHQLLAQNKSSQHLPPPPPYPEVTLHPVLVPQSSAASPPVQNSLLHGILTKSNSQQQQQQPVVGTTGGSAIQHRPTTFSPTLARLLTAPEKTRSNVRNTVSNSRAASAKSTLSELLNSKKTRTEVTITPVTTSSSVCKPNTDIIHLDEEEDTEERLVIDESRETSAPAPENQNQNPNPTTNVIPADQVPECQGCHKKAAQFVCAGCGNQWYCSRECQVQAWEDHSEMCSG